MSTGQLKGVLTLTLAMPAIGRRTLWAPRLGRPRMPYLVGGAEAHVGCRPRADWNEDFPEDG